MGQFEQSYLLNEQVVDLQGLRAAIVNIFEDLDEEKKNFDDERSATFNILDDLNLEKEKLNEKIVDLEKVRKELNESYKGIEKKVKERTLELEVSKKNLGSAYTKLKQSQETSKQIFLNTSHELKTPITPIIIQIELLKDEKLGALSLKQKKSMDLIARNIYRLDRLLTDILDISRIQAGSMKFVNAKVNIKEIIDKQVTQFIPLAKQKGIKLTGKTMNQLLVCDPQRIEQVIVNLLHNALKFTLKGSITVSTEIKKNELVVSVTDTGMGISKSNMNKLFTPFFQVTPSYQLHEKGTGLGLSICKNIIEKQGGRIWVESAGEGKGSTFYFTLPLTGEKSKGGFKHGKENNRKTKFF